MDDESSYSYAKPLEIPSTEFVYEPGLGIYAARATLLGPMFSITKLFPGKEATGIIIKFDRRRAAIPFILEEGLVGDPRNPNSRAGWMFVSSCYKDYPYMAVVWND